MLPVGASAPITFSSIGRSFPHDSGKSKTVVVVWVVVAMWTMLYP